MGAEENRLAHREHEHGRYGEPGALVTEPGDGNRRTLARAGLVILFALAVGVNLALPGGWLTIPRHASSRASSGAHQNLSPSAVGLADQAGAARLQEDTLSALDRLRVPFVPNEGQLDPDVAFYAPTFAGAVSVTQHGALEYDFGPPSPSGPASSAGAAKLTETFPGGEVLPAAGEPGPTRVSTFLSPDRARWRSSLATYEEVALGDVWPGVSVALRARGASVEKVFTVEPGAPVERIRVSVGGASALAVSSDGALVARTAGGDVTFTAPVAYQERDGGRREVEVAYRVKSGQDDEIDPAVGEYGFAVGDYDRGLPLVIDPVLRSTYLGNAGDQYHVRLAISPLSGDVYVAGEGGGSFPGVDAQQQSDYGDSQTSFVARLSADMATLHHVALLNPPWPAALAVHPTTGEVYLAGITGGSAVPGLEGGAQTSPTGADDVYIIRFGEDLSELRQATLFGGDSGTNLKPGRRLELGFEPASGDLYVAGSGAAGADIPGRTGGAQESPGEFFVARFDRELETLVRSTYLGSTEGVDHSLVAVAVLPSSPTFSGGVYVAGATQAQNFPFRPPVDDPGFLGFVVRISLDLTRFEAAHFEGVDDNSTGYPYNTQGAGATALAAVSDTTDLYVAGLYSVSNQTFGVIYPEWGRSNQVTRHANLCVTLCPHFGADWLPLLFVRRLDASTLEPLDSIEEYRGHLAGALVVHPTTGDIYVGGRTVGDTFFDDAIVERLDPGLSAFQETAVLDETGSHRVGWFDLALHPHTGQLYAGGTTSSPSLPGTAGAHQPTHGGGSDAYVLRLAADLSGNLPDLVLAKGPAGLFFSGQTGARFLLTVSNAGAAASTAPVTVADTLPAGLVATAIGGPGWDCTLATLTCTRGDSLPAGESWPPITVFVDVAEGAGSPLVNTAVVAGGGDEDTSNNAAAAEVVVLESNPLVSEVPALSRGMLAGMGLLLLASGLVLVTRRLS